MVTPAPPRRPAGTVRPGRFPEPLLVQGCVRKQLPGVPGGPVYSGPLPLSSPPRWSGRPVGRPPWSDYGPFVSGQSEQQQAPQPERRGSDGAGWVVERWPAGGCQSSVAPDSELEGGAGVVCPACDQLPGFTSRSPKGPPALGWQAGCIRGLWNGGPLLPRPQPPFRAEPRGGGAALLATPPHLLESSWSPFDHQALPG